MSLLKDIVAKGIYYNHIGIKDYITWSKMMFGAFGPEIKDYMKDIRKWSIAIPASVDDNTVPKLNCWEFMGCGLQVQEDSNLKVTALCPASLEKRYNGVYDGKNAGRLCWAVSQTFCSGKMDGTSEQKYKTCMICDFYKYVMEEEENNILPLQYVKNPLL